MMINCVYNVRCRCGHRKEVMLMMILHSDANCFYASVEMVENPDLRNQRIAVCGDPEQRHGIVLTANYPAKRMGVKTGMANWQAMQACPGLVKVKPHYDLYLKYSKLLQRIYKRYSDNVEPFGMDECWISLPYDEDDAVSVAEEIRQTVKDETGLTVSIGASFSKALAKLGSDMKKPDALTVLRKSDFKEKCWDLPVSDLLYVGPRTTKKLNNIAITTIGQLANAPSDIIARKFGKNGLMVQAFANGTDCSAVAPVDYSPAPKSIGHGATCTRDLEAGTGRQSPDDCQRVQNESCTPLCEGQQLHVPRICCADSLSYAERSDYRPGGL